MTVLYISYISAYIQHNGKVSLQKRSGNETVTAQLMPT
jgi:hypothetical protein